MRNLTKKDKLDFILKTYKEFNITATNISKNTKLTEAGVQRILNGTSKNPQENSLNEIITFFERKLLASQEKKEIDRVEEPATVYKKLEVDIKKYIDCIETGSKLRIEITKLQALLRKNNIPFVDFFEEE
jgi:ABC-type uncharacterized transport system ATPase subunit